MFVKIKSLDITYCKIRFYVSSILSLIEEFVQGIIKSIEFEVYQFLFGVINFMNIFPNS